MNIPLLQTPVESIVIQTVHARLVYTSITIHFADPALFAETGVVGPLKGYYVITRNCDLFIYTLTLN